MSKRSFPPPTLSPDGRQAAADAVRDLLARVQAAPEKDRWPGGEGAPDLIILLLRSAPIPFAVVEGCAAANDIPLPPVIEAHIGSELYQAYKEARGLGRGYSFMLLGDEGRADYESWLDEYGYAQTVVAGMRRDAAAADVPRPGRVLIYDDWECEGGTLHAADHLVRQAFPGTRTEVSLAGRELAALLDVPLRGLALSREEEQHARDFLRELAKGMRETPAGLVPLDTPQRLRRLGQQAQHRSGGAYPLLAEAYGDEQLLAFPARVRDAFRAWGRTVDPAPPPPPKTTVLLTGPPGIGKTTVLRETLSRLPPLEDDQIGPGGFVTVARPGGSGYDLLLVERERAPLATMGAQTYADPVAVSLPGNGTYTVDRAVLDDVGGASLALALLGRPVVVDEIGPFLFVSDDFCRLLWSLLNRPGFLLGAITPRSHPYADRIKRHPAVDLVAVTADNRDHLLDVLADRLAARLQVTHPLQQIAQSMTS